MRHAKTANSTAQPLPLLQLLGAGDTTAALDFRNQLSTAGLLLDVEIGDASFRVGQLGEFLRRNF